MNKEYLYRQSDWLIEHTFCRTNQYICTAVEQLHLIMANISKITCLCQQTSLIIETVTKNKIYKNSYNISISE